MNTQSQIAAALPEPEEDDSVNFIKTIPSIIWQRRWLILIPTLIATIAGVAAAYLIKPTYRADSTLVIQSPDIPDNLVPTNVGEAIDQRIARVRQQVLSRPDLIQMIRSMNLYPDMQASEPLSKIIDKMRSATRVEPIGGDVANGWRGGNTGTIAFNISYDYSEAGPAQLVVQQFVNSFLDRDASANADKSKTSVTFLQEQLAGIARQLQDVEGQSTALKSRFGPLIAAGQNSMLSGDPASDAMRVDGDIAALLTQNSQLAQTPNPNADDPDVKAAETNLRILQARYNDTHPDVVAAKAQLDSAKAAAAAKPKQPNPITQQIQANNVRINALRQAKSMMLSSSSQQKALASKAPAVVGQVDQLDKAAAGLRAQYDAVAAKLQNAQISSRMESENKGERMEVADPPTVPDSPFWPNRKLFILGGIIGGFGLGLALALLIEMLFKPIRGTESLRKVTGRPPLVVIPLLDRKPGLLVRIFERFSRRRLARRPTPVAS